MGTSYVSVKMLLVECTCVWRGWANNRQGYENETNVVSIAKMSVASFGGRGVQRWEGKREEQLSVKHKRRTTLEDGINSGSHFWKLRNHLES